MSVNKLDIRPSKANRPRNAFDLSQRHMFTAPVGALLPVLSLDLIPHDHVEINARDFMRTLPMNSAAFMSLRGVYEFFFVPYSQMWHLFDQFLANTNDVKSSLFIGKDGSYLSVPRVERTKLFDHISNLSDTDSTAKDIFGFSAKDNAIRLLDLLGYGYPASLSSTKKFDFIFNGSVSPFRAAAYQKIYSDFYRNNIFEPYEVSSFNFDDVNGFFTAKNFFDRFLKLRYRNAPSDYFTNLRPSPLVAMPNNLGNALSLSGTGSTYGTVDNKSAFYRRPNNELRIDVSSIRTAFALDKMLSISMRAGKTYAEQVEAHFGVKVSEGRDGQVVYIGGFDSNFNVGDVTQTSGTSRSSADAGYLGKVVGKSIAEGSGHISFDAKEHGVLMCIYSAVPAMQYDSTRVDPFVEKVTRGDFFIPEFENLGMQPLLLHNVTDIIPQAGNSVPKAVPDADYPLGWQLRYSEYKTALDVNHGQFGASAPLSFWTIARNRSLSDDFTANKTLGIDLLKICPKWCDSVFAVSYNGSQLTDQLFGGCYFGITKISDMSVDGLPSV